MSETPFDIRSESSWAQADVPWATLPPDPLSDEIAKQVIVVRQTWRRNMAGHAFLVSCDEAAAHAALKAAREVASSWGYLEEIRLQKASPRQLGLWRERLILPWQPVTFAHNRALKSLLFSANSGLSAIRLGEVEHLQVVTWQAGWQSQEMDPPTDNHFAYDPAYGYLQSDPAWAGAGLQIDAVVHLPALTAHRRLAQVHEGLQALSLLMHPEPMGTVSGQDAGYFRISSRGGLGQTAADLRLAFWRNLKPLLQWEADLRQTWWRRDTLLLRDRIRRSLRMLSEAQLLPLHEAVGFVSFVRLGSLLGEIEPEWLVPAEKVRVLSQSAHLGFAAAPSAEADKANKTDWQKSEDACRAEKVRTLWKLPGQKDDAST
jgi:protein-arginine kinase